MLQHDDRGSYVFVYTDIGEDISREDGTEGRHLVASAPVETGPVSVPSLADGRVLKIAGHVSSALHTDRSFAVVAHECLEIRPVMFPPLLIERCQGAFRVDVPTRVLKDEMLVTCRPQVN